MPPIGQVSKKLSDSSQTLQGEDLSGVEQVPGIERALDRAHHLYRFAQFADQPVLLAEPDAVLAGAGAVHGQGPLDQAAVEAFGLQQLFGMAGIDHEDDMEIAVADMAEDRRGNARGQKVALGLADAFGQAADRHADIGGPADAAGPQADGGVIGLVPRLPQPRAFLREVRPREVAAAILRRQGGHRLDLFGHRPLCPVELEEQSGDLGIVELRPAVDRHHLHVVENLDAGHRNAELNRLDDRIEILDDVQMMAVNRWSKLDYPEVTTLFFEFHGTERSVAEQVETVSALAAENGGGDFAWSNLPEERSRLWTARHEAYYAAVGLRPGCVGWPTDVCVPISRLAECIGETKRDLLAASIP